MWNSIMIPCAIAIVAMAASLSHVRGECELETVKMHAYSACDYIAEQLYADHQRNERQRRGVRHDAMGVEMPPGRSRHTNEYEPTTTDETLQQHHFKRRYHRPTHLSIRHLTDAYLVMDYSHARILRKHSSRRYKIMPTHYFNNNGTLQRTSSPSTDNDSDADDANDVHHSQQRIMHRHSTASSSPASIRITGHTIDRRHRPNHRHHPTTAATSSGHDDNDEENSIQVLSRRARNANVAVSSCCRDIERCLHTMCPL